MNPLAITSIADGGNFKKERVVMKAREDLDIGMHILLCAPQLESGVLPGRRTCYWFPDTKVKRGDFVVLYTKPGTIKSKEMEDGGPKAHFFYWSMDQALWGSENTAVLVEASRWSSRDVSTAKK